MKVTLLTYTPNPEKTIACAAKLCYSASTIDTVYDGLTEEKASDFVEMLAVGTLFDVLVSIVLVVLSRRHSRYVKFYRS